MLEWANFFGLSLTFLMSTRQLEQFKHSGTIMSTKLLIFAVLGGMALAILSVVSLWSLRNSIIEENVTKVRALSNMARETARFFHQRSQNGEFDTAHAQQLTRNVLRELNYGEIEDFFIYDFDGNCILLPQKPDREGKNFLDLRDEDGAYPVRKILISAQQEGQPIYYKLFPRNDSAEQKTKMVVAVSFEPWRWAIGTGIFTDRIEKQFWTAAWRMLAIIFAIALTFGLISGLLVRNIAMTFRQQTDLLHEYFNTSQTDPLTACNNRRSLLEIGERDFALAKRHNNKLSALMIDIDHFKQLNDSRGHSFGDQVLCALVDEIQCSIRGTDNFGRVGGEEFALLLPETDLDECVGIAEKLRMQIANLSLKKDGQEVHLTVSFGAACITENDQTIHDLLDRADKALYLAKKQGRNRVCAMT